MATGRLLKLQSLLRTASVIKSPVPAIDGVITSSVTAVDRGGLPVFGVSDRGRETIDGGALPVSGLSDRSRKSDLALVTDLNFLQRLKLRRVGFRLLGFPTIALIIGLLRLAEVRRTRLTSLLAGGLGDGASENLFKLFSASPSSSDLDGGKTSVRVAGVSKASTTDLPERETLPA